MEKKKLDFTDYEKRTIQINKNVIDVELFITPMNQAYLISEYLEDLYRLPKEGEANYNPSLRRVGAETMLMINVLERCTSVDTESITENEFLSANLFDIYKNTREVIHNWSDFRQVLDKTIEDKEKQLMLDFSVGKVLDGAIAKVIEAANWFTNLQINDEQLDKLKATAKEVTDEIAKANITQVLEEASKHAKSSKVKAKKVGNGSTIKQ